QAVQNPLATELLRGEFSEGEVVEIDYPIGPHEPVPHGNGAVDGDKPVDEAESSGQFVFRKRTVVGKHDSDEIVENDLATATVH
ncbi:MAG: hypothetical protein ABGX16_08620, partial [Pirellulales bacterium]